MNPQLSTIELHQVTKQSIYIMVNLRSLTSNKRAVIGKKKNKQKL
jgi:hypothetical protein